MIFKHCRAVCWPSTTTRVKRKSRSAQLHAVHQSRHLLRTARRPPPHRLGTSPACACIPSALTVCMTASDHACTACSKPSFSKPVLPGLPCVAQLDKAACPFHEAQQSKCIPGPSSKYQQIRKPSMCKNANLHRTCLCPPLILVSSAG